MPTKEILYSSPEQKEAIEIPNFPELLGEIALAQQGKPVIRHNNDLEGMDPDKGFDCSGLVAFALDRIGYPRGKLRHCLEFFDFLGEEIVPELRQKGDLVFFSWNGNIPQHMGIVISPRAYVHALLKTREVCVSSLKFREIVPGSKTIIPQKYPQNPIGIKRLV